MIAARLKFNPHGFHPPLRKNMFLNFQYNVACSTQCANLDDEVYSIVTDNKNGIQLQFLVGVFVGVIWSRVSRISDVFSYLMNGIRGWASAVSVNDGEHNEQTKAYTALAL